MAAESVPLGAVEVGVLEKVAVVEPGTFRRVVDHVQAVVYYGILVTGVLLPVVLLLIGALRG